MEEAGNGRGGRSGLILAISIGLALFFAAMVAIRANPFLTALNMLGCLLLLLLSAEVSVRGSVRQFIPWNYFTLLFPFKFIHPLIEALTNVISLGKRDEGSQQRAQIIRGIFVTVPVLILFAILFASADAIFQEYLSLIFDWNLDEEFIVRTILIIAATIGLIAGFSYTFIGKPDQQLRTKEHAYGVGTIETAILLGSVNVLFFTFIMIQISYFFGGASNITAEGLTYAEYARRGFFELIAVAVLSYVILAGAEKYIKRDSAGHSQQFKLLSSALALQVVIIMLSAFSRLSLYEEAFGFTTLRLYSHAFIIFLSIVFCFLLYKILIEHKDNTFAFRTFLAAVVFVAAMNIFNPDAFIATKNLERYEATGKLDANYLAGLSADATAITIHTLQLQDPDIRGIVGRALYERYYDRNSASAEWPSRNVSRYQETILLEKHADELLLYKNYESE